MRLIHDEHHLSIHPSIYLSMPSPVCTVCDETCLTRDWPSASQHAGPAGSLWYMNDSRSWLSAGADLGGGVTRVTSRPPPPLARQPILCYYYAQWRRQGGERGGGSFPYGWTSKNHVICVCFHCHGTSSYHTTNTKPYKFPMHCGKCVSFWETSYSRPPIDPYLTFPLL